MPTSVKQERPPLIVRTVRDVDGIIIEYMAKVPPRRLADYHRVEECQPGVIVSVATFDPHG